VHRVTESWTEGSQCYASSSGSELNWNNQPNYAESYGGTITANASDTDGLEYIIDITSLVQEWLDGTFPNNGVALIPSSTTGISYISVYSSDDVNGNEPRLEISCPSGNDFILQVDETTLPQDSDFTSENLQTASFTSCSQLDCNNNIGYLICPDPPLLGNVPSSHS